MKDIVVEINSPEMVLRFSTQFENKKCRLQLIAKETYFVTTDFEHVNIDVLLTKSILKNYFDSICFVFLGKFINSEETLKFAEVYQKGKLYGIPLKQLCTNKLDKITYDEICKTNEVTPLTIFNELFKLFKGYYNS